MIETDEDNEDKAELPVSTSAELIMLAKKLEARYISWVGPDSSTNFFHHIHAFQVEFYHKQMRNAKQTVLLRHGFIKLV